MKKELIKFSQTNYGMRNSFFKNECSKRLQQLKSAEAKAQKYARQQKKVLQQSRSQLLKKEESSVENSDSSSLQEVVRKIKINTLVDQFVYKMKRNVVSKQPVEYETIQKTLNQMKSHQNYLRSINIGQKLVGIFMVINIFAILIIQTMSAFQGFYISYNQDQTNYPILLVLEYFCLVVLFLKLLFSFFCNQNINGVREKYVRYVAKYYVMSLLFVFDFMNFIMNLFKILYPRTPVTGVLCFIVTAFSIPVFSKDFEIVETAFFNNYRRRQYFGVFKIFIFNIFFAQFVSSIMMAVSYYDTNNNWITKAVAQGDMTPNMTWWKLYFYSMYWAITTLTTIGYGDITPGNYFEVAFVAIMMLVGTAVLSYNLSEIGSVISNLRKIDKRRKEQTMIFKRMAKDESISDELMQKILGYIEKSAQVRAQFEFKERKRFLQELPEQLKEQFQIQYSNHIFSKIPFFNLLELSTLINISAKFKGVIYYKGQFLTKRDGTLASIMFLKHGKVGFAYHKVNSILNGLVLETREINQYKVNPYLLNKYLLTYDREINYQIIAENFCFLLILQYDDFYNVLRQSKKDKEFFFSLYNRISYIDEVWDQFECKYCAPQRHTVFLCPKLHYMPYKSIVLQRYIFSPIIPQKRIPIFNRKKYKLKKKKSLSFWKEFLKFIQPQFSTGVGKQSHRNLKQKKEMNEKEIEHHQKQTKSDQFIINVTQQVLRMHCCELSTKYEKKKELTIDKMHDFVYFFPDFNPSNIRLLSLKTISKKKFQIKRRF